MELSCTSVCCCHGLLVATGFKVLLWQATPIAVPGHARHKLLDLGRHQTLQRLQLQLLLEQLVGCVAAAKFLLVHGVVVVIVIGIVVVVVLEHPPEFGSGHVGVV